MRVRITFEVDIERTKNPDQHDEPEYAPQVDVKHSSILERAAQADFEPVHRIGFCRQEDA